ncbi:uncharacterized protein [Asterias amurensis]|uniref:uncharacterized protein n=1 Tax=Asterias amurensis TaxID=7602 RepID=UPI003AB2B201
MFPCLVSLKTLMFLVVLADPGATNGDLRPRRQPVTTTPEISSDGPTLPGLCTSLHSCRYRGCHFKVGNDTEPVLCQCDRDCAFFDDCCNDYTEVCNVMNEKGTSTNSSTWNLKLKHFSCAEVKGQHWGYFLVTACSDEYANTYIGKACADFSQSSFFSIAHVTSLTNGLTYRNIYCAICNNVTMSDIVAWPVDVQCKEELPQNLTRNLDYIMKNSNCSTDINVGHLNHNIASIPPIRQCFLDVISSCPAGHTLTGECKSYTAIHLNDSTLYRNPQCMMCQLSTNSSILSDTEHCEHLKGTVSTHLKNFNRGLLQRTHLTVPPISILLDFKSSNHVKIVRRELVVVDEEVTCKTGNVFDPFMSKCRRLFCQRGFVLDHNRCLKKQTRSTNANVGVVTISQMIANETQDNCHLDPETAVICIRSVLGVNTEKSDLEHEDNLQQESNRLCTYSYSLLLSSSIYHTIWEHLQHPLEYHAYINSTCPYAGSWSMIVYPPSEHGCNWRPLTTGDYTTSKRENVSWVTLISGKSSYPLSETRLWVTYDNMTGPNSKRLTGVEVCEDILFRCPLIRLNRTLFLFRKDSNATIVYIPTGQVFSKWEYADQEDEIELCSFLENNGSRNTSYQVEFFDYSESQSVVSLVGTIISLVAAALTFLTYFVFEGLRTHATCCIMNMIASLFMGQLLLLLAGSATSNPGGCTIIAFMGHYFWLVTIFWTAILAYDLNRTFACSNRKITGGRPTVRTYCWFSWGGGLLIVVPCLVIDLCDCSDLPVWYGDSEVCWIGNGPSSFIVFGAPLGIVLIFNFILFVLTVCGIRSTKRDTKCIKRDISKAKRLGQELLVYIKISTLLGFTWIFGFAAAISNVNVLWYIFIVLNSCQGLLIFLSFTCNPRVRMLWMEAFRGEMSTRPRSYSLGVASSTGSATRNSRV